MGKRVRSVRLSSARANVINAIALFVAIPAFGYSLHVNTPGGYMTDAGSLLASASASLTAQVSPNPYNTLAAQLSEKEALLNEREALLDRREPLSVPNSLNDNLGIISFVISIVLFILVGINFYFDMRRGGRSFLRAPGMSVDLR